MRQTQLGIYSGFPKVRVSPLEGIKEKPLSMALKLNLAKGATSVVDC
jgi:hypothetical protein